MKHLKKYKETSSGSTAYMFVECRQNHRYFVRATFLTEENLLLCIVPKTIPRDFVDNSP